MWGNTAWQDVFLGLTWLVTALLLKFREGFIKLELAVLYINATGIGRQDIVNTDFWVFVNKPEKNVM